MTLETLFLCFALWAFGIFCGWILRGRLIQAVNQVKIHEAYYYGWNHGLLSAVGNLTRWRNWKLGTCTLQLIDEAIRIVQETAFGEEEHNQ